MIPILLYASAVPTFSAVEDNVLLIALLAMLLDGVIIAIWYSLGTLLNNSGIKSSAVGELGQLIGTGVLIAIILVSLVSFSLIFYSSLNTSGGLLSSSVLQTQCTNLENYNSNSNNGLMLLGPTNSILSGPSTSTAFPYFPGLCNMLSYGPTATSSGAVSYGVDSQTYGMDYPLVASGVVLANLTNQTATNFNQSFTVDSYIGFLRKLTQQTNVCFLYCWTFSPVEIQVLQTPYAGYTLISNGLQLIGNLLSFALESYTAQLLLIILAIFIWPYLLFMGIVLRATFFTRKLGGLFIAIAISMVLIFPAVFAIEYISLGNGLQSGFVNTYGANSLISPSLNYLQFPVKPGYPPPETKSLKAFEIDEKIMAADDPLSSSSGISGFAYPLDIVNFYVEPKVINIAGYYECYPEVWSGSKVVGGIFYVEAWDLAYTLIPITPESVFNILYGGSGSGFISGSLNLFAQLLGNGPQSYLFPYQCPTQYALDMLYALLEAYGELAVSAYILPILNIIIMVVSIRGLSGLLGGDTSLSGLSRLV